MNDRGKVWDFDRLRKRIRYSLFRQRWNIAITQHSVAVTAGLCGDGPQRAALNDLIWMAEEDEGFAADPFIIPPASDEEHFHILFEFFPWTEKVGRIECTKWSGGNFLLGKTGVLDSPYHLSYPFVMQHEGRYVFIPEHAQSKDLSLYGIDGSGRANGKEMIRNDLPLIDSTFFQWHGKYWMFATHDNAAVNSDLYLYHAPTLKGPWTGHRRNPVKQDPANARPAGQIILHQGKAFRPAQDCASHYGSGIVVNEILTLSETEFDEQPVSEIRPSASTRYDYGLHTIASAGAITVIDGARLESVLHPGLDPLGRYVRP